MFCLHTRTKRKKELSLKINPRMGLSVLVVVEEVKLVAQLAVYQKVSHPRKGSAVAAVAVGVEIVGTLVVGSQMLVVLRQAQRSQTNP